MVCVRPVSSHAADEGEEEDADEGGRRMQTRRCLSSGRTDDTTPTIKPPAYRYDNNFPTMERYRGRERGGDDEEEAHDEDDIRQSTAAGGVEYRVEYRGRRW